MTVPDVKRLITIMDQAVSGTPCCCKDNFLANATINGEASGINVSLTAQLDILRGNCPTAIVSYFWWDCFTAQQEAGY
jgi:hypothetical protein